MIKFIDKEGIIYDGSSPYIHWVEGQQSTNIIYTMKLMVLSDIDTITIKVPENDVFRLIDPELLTDNAELKNITKPEITIEGSECGDYYVYQILLVASSETPCQATEHLTIEAGDEVCDTIVGGDFYGLNEVLSINLENRGLELPVTIQKAIFESDIHNDITDNILINRKFKELISNYLDIVDNKGSYLSLYNSLQWFEWGDYAKLYEIWETDKDRFLEKDMEFTLSDIYQALLSSARKTTHISLTAALNKTLSESDVENFDKMSHDEKVHALLDDDKNPRMMDIVNRWTKDDLYVKIGILGAFFERYFMPIHLDLKRVAMEALVYTPWINMANGTLYRTSNFSYDDGIVNIDMDHTVTLGNLEGYSVGVYTMFGIKDMEKYYGETHVFPIGVDPINKTQSTMPAQLAGLIWDEEYETSEDDTELKIEWDKDNPNPEYNIGWEGSDINYGEHDDVAITFSQTGGHVGVIVPIKAYFDLPEDDIIHRAELYVYRGKDKESMSTKPDQYIIEKGLWKPQNGVITFNFNLLSLTEEVVSFVLVFHSTSGHIWTAASSYESIDVSGSYLKIYRIENTDNSHDSENIIYDSITGQNEEGKPIKGSRYWLKGSPYGIQYNTITLKPDTSDDNIESIYDNLVQYLPTNDYKQLNQLFLVENINIFPGGFIYQYKEIESLPPGVTAELVSETPVADETSPDYIELTSVDPHTYYEKTHDENETVIYDTNWIYDYKRSGYSIADDFWVFGRGEIDSYDKHRYYVIISKKPGKIYDNVDKFIVDISSNYEYNGTSYNINPNNIKRNGFIFIPQLHQYNDIEKLQLKKNNTTKKYEMTENDYLVRPGTLLSIIPQFRRSIMMDTKEIKWEFKNISRPDLDPIIYKQPVSEIMITDAVYKDLSEGYWAVTMYYKMVDSGVEHKLTKNSAFKIKKIKEES